MRGWTVSMGSFRMGAGLVVPDFAGMSGPIWQGSSGHGLTRGRGRSVAKVSSAGSGARCGEFCRCRCESAEVGGQPTEASRSAGHYGG